MKNNYFFYNLKGIARMLVPSVFLPKNREKILKNIHDRADIDYIKSRVDYYCQLSSQTPLDEAAKRLSYVRFTRKKTVYFFDTYEFTRYFPQHFRANFAFGDVNFICPKPSITKSRPIKANLAQNLTGGGANTTSKSRSTLDSIPHTTTTESSPPFAYSTLLNLEKVRHFTFINDPYSFESKQDRLFYRGGIYQPHRINFFEKYFEHALCDLGHTGSKAIHPQWQKPKLSLAKHLPYKFLLSLEGNDVASNLKWVMSSNSLCVMPKPKFETWFMEGTLLPNVHYAEITESNVEAVLEHFIKHPNDAKDIIHNAHLYTQQFFDKKREAIISLLVLEKYFYYTGQLDRLRI
ncbi:lipopolysaccharide core biosynthesis protein LpsA [Helicobacter jaachi]|uniref:Lipopolysaccharide core biosynthesis protein LpsA n=1 Tax=Helicobacter jaachi TaxID=1677920 RepID=A0A4V6YSA8_9HELI|nr:glycosyl transferase family 90 [Helicobacter jaachi]TLD96882.1 lipopolysaccharide core biosynthesis protein LpsA [Helicobacter jaachi]